MSAIRECLGLELKAIAVMVDFMESEENVVAAVAKDDIVAEDIQVAKNIQVAEDVAEQPTKQVSEDHGNLPLPTHPKRWKSLSPSLKQVLQPNDKYTSLNPTKKRIP